MYLEGELCSLCLRDKRIPGKYGSLQMYSQSLFNWLDYIHICIMYLV